MTKIRKHKKRNKIKCGGPLTVKILERRARVREFLDTLPNGGNIKRILGY